MLVPNNLKMFSRAASAVAKVVALQSRIISVNLSHCTTISGQTCRELLIRIERRFSYGPGLIQKPIKVIVAAACSRRGIPVHEPIEGHHIHVGGSRQHLRNVVALFDQKFFDAVPRSRV